MIHEKAAKALCKRHIKATICFIYKNKTLYKYVNKFYICYLSKNQHKYMYVNICYRRALFT